MPERRLIIPDYVSSLVRSLHPGLKKKIKAALSEILSNSESGKPLKDELEGLRSLRVARYRIIFRIKIDFVEIIAVGSRKTIYEETYRLLKK